VFFCIPHEGEKPMIQAPRVLSSGTLLGCEVVNIEGEKLGKVESFAVDLEQGRLAYMVLSFGGFLGFGDKWFAVPWEALEFSHHDQRFILNVEKEVLKEAPGFDREHWPSIEDHQFAREVYKYYGRVPYWEQEQTQSRSEERVESQGETEGVETQQAESEFTPLLPNQEVGQFWSQWNAIQAEFVDHPETSVEAADSLVAQVMKRLAEIFSKEREKLESQWRQGEEVSTEDLRVALQRYRSFFNRLLSLQ
jgi:PRC-barrel domain